MTERLGEVIVQEEDNIIRSEGHRLKARVASVDALRGLTIFLMIFVNDLGPGLLPGCTTSSPRTPTA